MNSTEDPGDLLTAIHGSKAPVLSRHTLTNRQMCDLELLLNGGFAPLTGFLTEDEYRSVVDDARLPSGAIWPIPIVLDVDRPYELGETVALCDEFGTPLAHLTVTSCYKPDKMTEARMVYGTTDTAHPGVAYLMQRTNEWYLGGSIEYLALPERFDFKHLRSTPADLRAEIERRGWKKVIGFQTRNPLHRAHFEIIKNAAEEHGGKILLHPVVGETKAGDIDYRTRVHCYEALERYFAEFGMLRLLPLAMRMAGPREALWHALIRKNYGCTHFIVGRDHAGPGNGADGKPFYGPYDAQQLALTSAPELGIAIIPVEEMAYVEEDDAYRPVSKIPADKTVRNISGTEVRSRLETGADLPTWFSFPEVAAVLRRDAEKRQTTGFTIFFTGLPSAGKSTTASILAARLLELQPREITLLDGDVVRLNLSRGLGFSREDRMTNIERIGFVASEITKHRGIAICSAIAPFQEARDKNRQLISKYGLYIEVYMATPLAVCQARDPKGLYQKAALGLITGVTGMDDPYEVPEHPEITLDTSIHTPYECVDRVMTYLKEKKLIQ